MTPAADTRLDLATVLKAAGRLPSLPAIALDLLGSIDDEDTTIDALARKLASDQSMAARLLRIANSSFYGQRRSVLSVRDAIVVLGIGNVRSLALAAALTTRFNDPRLGGVLNLRAFWRHGMATALCARALSSRIRCNRESAFAAGLLHDFGALVLATCFPLHMAQVQRHRVAQDLLDHEAEQQLLRLDHAQVGGLMAERWNFPPQLCAAVAHHHDFAQLTQEPLAMVVHLADAIVHALDLNDAQAETVPPLCDVCWQQAGLAWPEVQAVFAEVETGLESFGALLSGS